MRYVLRTLDSGSTTAVIDSTDGTVLGRFPDEESAAEFAHELAMDDLFLDEEEAAVAIALMGVRCGDFD